MTTLTPYRAFNTSTFGVKGTAMVAFPQLSEEERWALGFFVFTFRQPACDHVPPLATLQELAQSTDGELAAKYGEKEVACLRRQLPEEKVAAIDKLRTTEKKVRCAFGIAKAKTTS
jgi:high-affinity iron transporter